MSWTDGKPFIATEADCKANWACQPNGAAFRCALCGYRFKVGDTVRWQYTNDTKTAGGNPLVCVDCDTGREGIIAEITKRRELIKEMKSGKYWWFLREPPK